MAVAGAPQRRPVSERREAENALELDVEWWHRSDHTGCEVSMARLLLKQPDRL
jgi:hypothetical protein